LQNDFPFYSSGVKPFWKNVESLYQLDINALRQKSQAMAFP